MKKKRGNRRGGQFKQENHGYLLNDKIRADSVRVIGSGGENLGILSLNDAILAAESEKLDLVQIGKDNSGVVTARIMDLGRFLYEKKKAASEAKKKQKTIDVKEVKMRPGIDVGDFSLKAKKIADFIKEGMHVKVTIQFRGREMALRSSTGPALFEKILKFVREELPGYVVEYQKEIGAGSLWTRVLTGKVKK